MHSGSFHGELVQQRIDDLHREANQARPARQARLAERNRRTATQAGHAPATTSSLAGALLAAPATRPAGYPTRALPRRQQ